MLTKTILHVEKSKFQDVELVETGPFGKVRPAGGAAAPTMAAGHFRCCNCVTFKDMKWTKEALQALANASRCMPSSCV